MKLIIGPNIDEKNVRLDFKASPSKPENIPSYTIKGKILPSGAAGKLTYSSSNKKVAVVNQDGKVTAKKKGTAKITVKIGKIKKVCKVTVK